MKTPGHTINFSDLPAEPYVSCDRAVMGRHIDQAKSAGIDALLGHATVSLDGGKPVTERGFCWSTTNGIPTITDNLLVIGSGVGNFTDSLKNLQEGLTYYVRAYAINSFGIGYSPAVTSFKICNPLVKIHQAGLNGAPEDKTVTYQTISTSVSGAPRCWITQNSGADKEATSVTDTDQASAGWYWQFNRLQGYIPVGTTSFSPSYAWDTWLKSNNENSDCIIPPVILVSTFG